MVDNDNMTPIADDGICQIRIYNQVTGFNSRDKQYKDPLHHLFSASILVFLDFRWLKWIFKINTEWRF